MSTHGEPWQKVGLDVFACSNRLVARCNTEEDAEHIATCVNELAGMDPSKLAEFIGLYASHAAPCRWWGKEKRCTCGYDAALTELRKGAEDATE